MVLKHIDIKTIKDISKKTKFHEPTVERVLWLTRVIKELVKTEVGKNFVLMGGSAIVFLYENMYRLSIDLDMDYIGNSELGKGGLEEIIKLQENHCKIIRSVSQSLGLRYKHIPQKEERFLRIQLSFPSYYTKFSYIDLDMGYRYCHTVIDPPIKQWESPFLINLTKVQFKVQTFASEELWASKIVAAIGGKRMDFEGKVYLGSKNKIRHLYDLYHLASKITERTNANIDFDMLKKLVILFGMTRIKDFELFRGDLLSTCTQKDIETGLYPVLKKDKPYPTLLTMQRKVRRFLDHYIYKDWGDAEYRFCEAFSSGNFYPEDLFGKVNISNRLLKMYYYKELLHKFERQQKM